MSASRLKADVLGHAINGACQNPGVVVSSIPRWDKWARNLMNINSNFWLWWGGVRPLN
jgi:hypothetical protein